MPAWYEDLRNYKHSCGEPLLVGFTANGYQEWPVFQTEPRKAVKNCPRCGVRLNLNSCRQVKGTGGCRCKVEGGW